MPRDDNERLTGTLELCQRLIQERNQLREVVACLLEHGSGRCYLDRRQLIHAPAIVVEPDDDGILVRLVDSPDLGE